MMRVPAALILITAVGHLLFSNAVHPLADAALQIITVIVFLSAIALSYWFHANRTLFTSLLLFLLAIFAMLINTANFRPYRTASVLHSLQLIAPLLFVIISFSPKRRILSWFSLIWITSFLLTGMYLYLLPHNPVLAFPIQLLSDLQLLPYPVTNYTGTMNDFTIWIGIAGAAAMFRISIDRRNEPAFAAAWIGAYITSFIGLNTFHQQLPALMWFAASGASITVALVQHAYALAFVDELTRVPNRRALQEHLMNVGNTYALAMVDIDHFKQFNDTHGHETGDQVLRRTAAQLTRVEGGGKVFRYGGEEFTIVFIGKKAKEAARYCDLVRKIVAEEPFYRRDTKIRKRTPLHITVSMGVSEPTSKNPTAEMVLKIADKALYRAKKQGRNKVVAAI